MGLFNFFKKKKKNKMDKVILNPVPSTRPSIVTPSTSNPPPVPKADPAPTFPPPQQVSNPEPPPATVKTPDPIVERSERALASSTRPESSSMEPIPEKTPKEIVVPTTKNGKKIKYHYDRVRVFVPKQITVDYDLALPGEEVVFVPEPTNAYDPKAVLVVHSSGNIGYLYKGKQQDMVNDYIKAGLPVYGHIDSTDDDNNQITVFMAFYGSTSSPQKSKIYKLTATKSKAAQEAIDMLSKGDELDPSYDAEKDKYILYDYSGEVIGTLPKSAEDHVQDKTCFVSSIEEDDNGKFDVFVYFE